MVFVHYRAAVLAFTYDESWTFNAFARAEWGSTFWNLDPVANNHILHSLLMKASWMLFGASEYSLRLPVLAAHILFLIISYKLVKQYLPKYAIWAFLALNLQPYLLDYFVTARGYALSISFMLTAYYFILKFWDDQKIKSLIWLGFFASLSVWANFSYLLVFVSLIATGLGVLIYQKKTKLKYWIALFFFPVLIMSILYWPFQRLVDKGELFFGGDGGFYSETVLSLSKRMLYNFSDSTYLLSVFPALIVACLGMGIWQIIKHWKANPKERLSPLFLHIIIFSTPIIGSVLLHFLLRKPYLYERTALFILPLSLIFLFAVFGEMDLKVRGIIVNKWFISLFSFLLILNFIQAINFSYVVDFKEHSDTRKALLNLRNIRVADQQNYFHIGKSKYMNATINYYRFKEQLKFLPSSDLRFCNEEGPYPYYYLFEEDLNCISHLNLKLIEFFPISKTYLYRNEDYINKTIKK